MSPLFSNGRLYRQWPSKYLESRKPKDDRPYVDSLNEHDPFNEGVRLFLQQYEHDKTFFPVEVVSHFCHNTSRQDMFTSSKRTAWLDDRLQLPISELAANTVPYSPDIGAVVLPIADIHVESATDEPAGVPLQQRLTTPIPREYDECLTPGELYCHLRQKRFDHDELEDADRRLVYIADPDPCYILALTNTEREYQRNALLELLWKFIDRQTSLEVSIPLRGYSVFQLEIHLPCFALRFTPLEELKGRKRKAVHTDWMDLSFLEEDAEEGIIGIHLAHFSLVVCGTDNLRWTAYALETKSFDPDRGDEFRIPDRRSDEISMGQLDADKTIWDPREYFLNICQIRVEHMVKETRDLVGVIEASYKRRVLCQQFSHAARNNKSSTLDWNEDMLLLMQHLIPSISKATESWSRFAHLGKDIEYFRDSYQYSSADSRARNDELLRSLDQAFGKMECLQATLQKVEERCEKLAERLGFGLARQGSQIGEFTISVVSPIVIVASIFAIPDPVLSYPRNSLSFFLTIAVGILSLQVLLLINGGWQRRQRWLDKLYRRLQAARHGDETLTTRNAAGRRVIRRRSTHVDSLRDP
jgi:hypothetical protein